jgi:predicted enzyme related to lactoylglutathione lyase
MIDGGPGGIHMRRTRLAAAIALSILPALAWAGAAGRVTGIGGVFIKAKDPAALRAWYKKHLGFDIQAWGGATFRWVDGSGHPTAGSTAWFAGNGKNFAPSTSSFMINYRVADLHAVLAALRAEGCDVLDKTDESAEGKFGWVMDPEGNKVELWQPPEGK